MGTHLLELSGNDSTKNRSPVALDDEPWTVYSPWRTSFGCTRRDDSKRQEARVDSLSVYLTIATVEARIGLNYTAAYLASNWTVGLVFDQMFTADLLSDT